MRSKLISFQCAFRKRSRFLGFAVCDVDSRRSLLPHQMVFPVALLSMAELRLAVAEVAGVRAEVELRLMWRNANQRLIGLIRAIGLFKVN